MILEFKQKTAEENTDWGRIARVSKVHPKKLKIATELNLFNTTF